MNNTGDQHALKDHELLEALECNLSGNGGAARLRDSLALLAADVRVRAEQPEEFWRRQRAAIAAGIQLRPAPASPLLRWALATAVILAAAVLGVVRPAPVDQRALLAQDPDHQLLLAVEESLSQPVPESLEPAVLITMELERASANGPGGNP